MKKIPIYYLHLQKKLSEIVGAEGTMDKKEAFVYLRRFAVGNSFPKPILFCVLKEMEQYGLIYSINRRSYKINEVREAKLLDDSSRLYQEAGLWK